MAVMIEKMCRTCLKVDTAMLSLFGSLISGSNMPGTPSVAEMLRSSFTSVTISETDDLPKQVCLSCIREISLAYLFKIKCENSQNTLKEYLQQSAPMNESSVIDNNGVVSQDVKIECECNEEGSTVVVSRHQLGADDQTQDREQPVQEHTKSLEHPDKDDI